MVKTMQELKADLEREPTEATLRNVLSDLKGADNGRLREYAEEMEERLEDAAPPYQNRDDRVRMIVERVVGLLNMQGRGRRRKTTRRR
jgi:pyruvate-formate lyase